MASSNSQSILTVQTRLQNLQQSLSKNKSIHQQLTQLNRTLKHSLNQLKLNIQTKIKPSHNHLYKQRKVLVQLLNYNNNLFLKDNFICWYQSTVIKKNYLSKRLSQAQTKQKQLQQISNNLSQDIMQNQLAQKEINQVHQQMKKQITNLQKVKVQAKQISNHHQQKNYIINHSNNSDLVCLHDKHSQNNFNNQSFSNDNSLIQLSSFISSHHSIEQSNKIFKFHPDTFKDAQQIFDTLSLQNKPKSKQILHSLQKELNPLELKEMITLLEEQIQHLKKNQLNPLRDEKKVQERKRTSLKNKENCMLNKLEIMKMHIKKFKLQKFGQQ